MRLILVRHGQTDWNKKQLFQGHSDVELNSAGREQARKAAAYLAGEDLEVIYCSDLVRARETAALIAGSHALEPITDPRLREINFGLWEGLDFNEIYSRYRQEYENWYQNTGSVSIPGGESLKQVLARMLEFIREIAPQHRGSVVIVTHGGAIKALLWHVLGQTVLWEKRINPGSISYFSYESGELTPLEINLEP